jgi:hypothetical protein
MRSLELVSFYRNFGLTLAQRKAPMCGRIQQHQQMFHPRPTSATPNHELSTPGRKQTSQFRRVEGRSSPRPVRWASLAKAQKAQIEHDRFRWTMHLIFYLDPIGTIVLPIAAASCAVALC